MTVALSLGPLFVDLRAKELQAEEKEILMHPLIGGVILFSRNYESVPQLATLVGELKSLRHPSLLIAVDQEGGRVQRFREGFTRLPPGCRYGELYDSDPKAGLAAARNGGYVMAVELRGPGVDFSFAPVLDVASANSAVIGDRAFHSDPNVVSSLANAFIEGMKIGGMMSVGKHFPGHGGVMEDSHECVPTDPRTLQQLTCSDLVPYRNLRSVLGGVMTAHVLFGGVNKELPTYSRYWLHDLLRKEIGFKGAIFSDDLSMEGAKGYIEPEDRVDAASEAGCDAVLICNDPAAVEAVIDRCKICSPSNTPPSLLAMKGYTPDMIDYEDALESVKSMES